VLHGRYCSRSEMKSMIAHTAMVADDSVHVFMSGCFCLFVTCLAAGKTRVGVSVCWEFFRQLERQELDAVLSYELW
jgi:NADH:ubiquinone oxidoreductase subunit K